MLGVVELLRHLWDEKQGAPEVMSLAIVKR